MWENIPFFRSRWKLASLSSSISIFIIMVNFRSSGFGKGTGGKSGKFLDCDGCILFTRRSINIKINFPFPYTICPFTLFFAAELSLISQRLILLYRSLKFSGRNSIIGCNYNNTWRVFGAKLIDKVARTLFHSLLLFLLR